ncbi:MAG: response regulator transcription factor [Spirochaetaceae bacterium]|nr:response regulator transcription factor [Spirochaetaceae bacterium]
MVRIILIDSQAAFREAMKELLSRQVDFELAGVGKDGYDAIRLAEKVKPDVVILDMELPLFDGLKAAASIMTRCPSCAVIISAAKMDDSTIYNAIYHGVTGFVLRSSMFEEISRAIRNVAIGKSYMSRPLMFRAFNIFSGLVRKQNGELSDVFTGSNTVTRPLNITRAESRIAAYVANGLSNRQIAEILKLKEGTIRNYISNILQRTNLKHRTQIALYALNNGLHDKSKADCFN